MRSLTVGVVGTGKIGAAVIKNLRGFGCKILAYGRHESDELKQYATYVSLEELYHQSDIITLHLPLTPHMAFYTEEAIKSMVETGILGLLDMQQHEKGKLEVV